MTATIPGRLDPAVLSALAAELDVLTPELVRELRRAGVILPAESAALDELAQAGYVDRLPDGSYRLSDPGILRAIAVLAAVEPR